jgi:hypothetical protein
MECFCEMGVPSLLDLIGGPPRGAELVRTSLQGAQHPALRWLLCSRWRPRCLSQAAQSRRRHRVLKVSINGHFRMWGVGLARRCCPVLVYTQQQVVNGLVAAPGTLCCRSAHIGCAVPCKTMCRRAHLIAALCFGVLFLFHIWAAQRSPAAHHLTQILLVCLGTVLQYLQVQC